MISVEKVVKKSVENGGIYGGIFYQKIVRFGLLGFLLVKKRKIVEKFSVFFTSFSQDKRPWFIDNFKVFYTVST